MPTDKERREVAARLREQRKKMDAERPPSVPVLAAAEYLLRISHVVLRDEDNGRVFDRLADLIDNPTCRFDYRAEAFTGERWFECSACHKEYATRDFAGKRWRYCPNCGAEVEEGEA